MIKSFCNETRHAQNLMSLDDLIDLANQGNTIYDPFSLLISKNIIIGTGNIFFPNVTLICSPAGNISLKNRNIFFPNAFLNAGTGSIIIGSHNSFGEGGFTAKTEQADTQITIGNYARFQNNCTLYGPVSIGDGAQVLGPIQVMNCTLEAGGSFQEEDVDKRAGVLKGTGRARNLTVPMGHVILGNGTFNQNALEKQSAYHPKIKKEIG